MKKLSERELQVAQRLFEGDTRKEAGKALGITENTVRAHIDRIYRKIGGSGKKAKSIGKYYLTEHYRKQ